MSAVATRAALDRASPGAREPEDENLAPGDPCDSASLSIIIPTFNEAGNIVELLERIAKCLHSADWEVIVVDDDSADGTAEIVTRLSCDDPRVRCLKRVGRRGLSSACLEGMSLSTKRFLAVIDADLQHDEQLLPAMLRVLAEGRLDLVVGSRYLHRGSVAAWSRRRRWLSRGATAMTRRLLAVGLTDPMSGFFMIRRQVVTQVATQLSNSGFKLLLDLVTCSPQPLRLVELPYTFSPRRHGQSKLDANVLWSFLGLLLRGILRRSCGRFCRFCLIGTSGVFVHFAVFEAAQTLLALSFPAAQTAGVLVSLVSNFVLNNRLTFDASRLRGTAFFTGLSRFAVLCSIGAIVNVAVADAVVALSGWRLIAAGAGILAGAICNYATTSALVWHRQTRGPHG